jgi:hypothetical protein
MKNALLPEALDTRIVFKTYAITAWVAGTLLYACGPLFFSIDLGGMPHGAGVIVRIIAAILAGAGCIAWSAGLVRDPQTGRSMLRWWAGRSSSWRR